MEASIIKKVRDRDLFIYGISGVEAEISEYKKFQNNYFRNLEDGTPLFFTKFYYGSNRPFIYHKDHYILDAQKLIALDFTFRKYNQNLWDIIDHCIAKDPRKKGVYWALNKFHDNSYNSSIHKTPLILKDQLFEILLEYGVTIVEHARLNESEIKDYIDEIEDMETEAFKDAEMDRGYDKMNQDETDSWGDDWYWNIE